jgi:hypothetical protein
MFKTEKEKLCPKHLQLIEMSVSNPPFPTTFWKQHLETAVSKAMWLGNSPRFHGYVRWKQLFPITVSVLLVETEIGNSAFPGRGCVWINFRLR